MRFLLLAPALLLASAALAQPDALSVRAALAEALGHPDPTRTEPDEQRALERDTDLYAATLGLGGGLAVAAGSALLLAAGPDDPVMVPIAVLGLAGGAAVALVSGRRLVCAAQGTCRRHERPSPPRTPPGPRPPWPPERY